MDFAIRNLSVLSYAQGFTAWHYRAPTVPLAVATAPDFFSPAADMICVGDTIVVSAAGDGALLYVVASGSVASGVVVKIMASTVTV